MSIKHERQAGEPDRHVWDVSDQFGGEGGALLLTSGVPDFVTTPEGFAFQGIGPGERCDVVRVWQNTGDACPMCSKSPLHKLWSVRHSGTGLPFVIFECAACGQFSWAVHP